MTQNTKENIVFPITHLLTELKFISTIKAGEKIFFRNTNDTMKLNIDNSLIPQFSRWYNSYNRFKTIEILENLYKTVFELITFILNKNSDNIEYLSGYKNNDLLHILIKHLENSIEGLNSLKITYANDKFIISQFNTLIDEINLKKTYAMNIFTTHTNTTYPITTYPNNVNSDNYDYNIV